MSTRRTRTRRDDAASVPANEEEQPKQKRGRVNSPAVAVAAADASTSSSPSCSASVPDWRLLVNDCLCHVATFLDLKEVPVAMRVRRAWRSVLSAEVVRPSGASFELTELSHWWRLAAPAALQAPLLRHVADLTIKGMLLYEADVKLVGSAIPNLRACKCSIVHIVSDEDASPFVFPGRLTKLDLRIKLEEEDEAVSFYQSQDPIEAAAAWSFVKDDIKAVANISSLTTVRIEVAALDIDVKLSPANMPTDLLEPLLGLSESLTSLDLVLPVGGGSSSLSSDAIAVFRMPHLTSVSLNHGTWEAAELKLLTADPPPLNLRRLEIGRTSVDEKNVESIARMTSLIDFSPIAFHVPKATFLSRFTDLEEIQLICSDLVDIPILTEALSKCPRIHTLSLQHYLMTCQELTCLLAVLPALRTLILHRMASLRSLAFVSQVPHIASSLESLEFCSCKVIPPEEIVHLRALKSLRKLEFSWSFKPRPKKDVIASLTPGSPTFDREAWPHLVTFKA